MNGSWSIYAEGFVDQRKPRGNIAGAPGGQVYIRGRGLAMKTRFSPKSV